MTEAKKLTKLVAKCLESEPELFDTIWGIWGKEKRLAFLAKLEETLANTVPPSDPKP